MVVVLNYHPTLSPLAAQVLDQNDWNEKCRCWSRELGSSNEKFASYGGYYVAYITSTDTGNGQQQKSLVSMGKDGNVDSIEKVTLQNGAVTDATQIIADSRLKSGEVKDKDNPLDYYHDPLSGEMVKATNIRGVISRRSADNLEILAAQQLVQQKIQEWPTTRR